MRHARFPALVIAVALAATACTSSGADPEPTPSTTTAPETASETPPSETPTASEVDLSAPPPDEVTEEYVQAVLEAIYEVEAEVIRREVAAAEDGATAPPEGAIELLSTIYDGEQLTFALQDLGDDWQGGELVDAYASDPSPSIVDAKEILESTEDCILATFQLDRSPTLQKADEPTLLVALLRPKAGDVDPTGANPAPWVIDDQGIVSPSMEASCD